MKEDCIFYILILNFLMNLTQKDLSNFSATEYFAPEQLITIKGKVVGVSPVKSLNTQRPGRHNEQQVTIRIQHLQDMCPLAGIIILIPWMLIKLFELQNIIINFLLNTAKSEKFIFKETCSIGASTSNC